MPRRTARVAAGIVVGAALAASVGGGHSARPAQVRASSVLCFTTQVTVLPTVKVPKICLPDPLPGASS
ncbi:MAG: hypothetical protein JO079_13240 [Frankiaceae bacterium]|nr:hypothetical protein [Frankiaceae bacterium]MBV9369731.1 hypothetical protein [Frankiales bacterium]